MDFERRFSDHETEAEFSISESLPTKRKIKKLTKIWNSLCSVFKSQSVIDCSIIKFPAQDLIKKVFPFELMNKKIYTFICSNTIFQHVFASVFIFIK